ncbi:zinc finger CCCH-type with G patch domain-containing protein-like isoform X1 [Amphibalanus amphitrite]|uniref:zinc finger CCCH-type with G patch domain-containing protein-like isoform X1 n=1 Tax=Amphibalanus amphitrite TaxID=1232801 RepID=UPI001C918BDB|nr:zinc finger CCCH-type with G patch domain-containing protein-like isoform X1 [Amphibalanus amphitrite]
MDEANLNDYMIQLEQVNAALAAAPDNEELRELASSLTELIGLTQLQHSSSHQTSSVEPTSEQGLTANARGGQATSLQNSGPAPTEPSRSLDDEMALFKMEIEAVEQGQQTEHSPTESSAAGDDGPSPPPPGGSAENLSLRQQQQRHTAELKSSLEPMVGTRCSAPFTQSWGQLEYHAAVIEAVDDASLESATTPQDVMLRVLFSHPTQRVMQPCRYYLRHTCSYGDECRFSHGHLVSVADIREYSDSASELTAGSAVLVPRDSDSGLWQRAVVQLVHTDTEEATVRPIGHRHTRHVPLSQLVPLAAADGAVTGDGSGASSSDSETESEPGREPEPDPEPDPEQVEFCPRLTWNGTLGSTSQLGAWEKHTKGIGSRLLQQMGYVVGTGLGPQADGRVEPVEARVYPAGRSLDHCMALREGSAAAGQSCLLTVEKRLERDQRRQQKIGERAYQRSKAQNAMFDVINRVMGAEEDGEDDRPPRPAPVKSASRAELNLRDLKVGEQIRAAERQVARLEAGCRRNSAGATGADLRSRLADQKAHLGRLRAQEASIHAEKRERTTSKRLDVF